MKKLVKTALAAVLVCFSSSLFAAEPVSFLNDTTYELFEDETVDNFAWGLKDEDVKGIVLGAFDSSSYNFSIAAGAYLGNAWWSLYDTGDFFADITKTRSVTNDAVAADGINTDYVDVESDTYKTRNNDNYINNELYLSYATDSWGLQSYWLLTDTTGDGKFGKETKTAEAHVTGQSDKTVTKISKYDGTNTFGANFKGFALTDIGSLGMYFQLNNFEVAWENTSTTTKVEDSNKQNGFVYSSTSSKEKDAHNKFTPRVSGEMGFDLPEIGSLSTKLVVKDELWLSFGIRNNKNVVTTVAETADQKVTTTTTTTRDYHNATDLFTISNTISPSLVFDFNVGERLSVKASAGFDLEVANEPGYKVATQTKVVETTTYDKNNKTTTKNYKKDVTAVTSTNPTLPPAQYVNSINTTATVNTALALVYQVKPGKFNLNMGLKWNPATLSWANTTAKNYSYKTSSYESNTNSAGSTTVSKDEVTWHTKDTAAAGDGTPESKNTDFDLAAAGTPELKIGATWFITPKASLDIAYDAEFNPGTLKFLTGLLDSSLKLMFSIKF